MCENVQFEHFGTIKAMLFRVIFKPKQLTPHPKLGNFNGLLRCFFDNYKGLLLPKLGVSKDL